MLPMSISVTPISLTLAALATSLAASLAASLGWDPATVARSRCCGTEPSSCCSRLLEVELLALDLSTCGRCTGTEVSVEAALSELRPLLTRLGVGIRFERTVVRTAEEATVRRLLTSPTLRVNGRDVPVELRETACGDCDELCGGGPVGAPVDCRAWVWQGKLFTEPPAELIIDAILRSYATAFDAPIVSAAPTGSEPFRLPENLQRFFAARAAAGSATPNGEGPAASNPGHGQSGAAVPVAQAPSTGAEGTGRCCADAPGCCGD